MKYKVNKSDPGLNIAPLIDVVFLLLIFFIVASTLNVNQVQTGLELPGSSETGDRAAAGIAVSLNQEGQVFLGDRQVDIDQLPAAVREMMESRDAERVTIYADRRVDFERVVMVMETLQAPGLEQLSFALRHESK